MTAAGVRRVDHALRERPPRSHRRSSPLRLLAPALVLLVLATTTAVGSASRPAPPPYPPGDLPIATGERGSVHYSYGVGLLDAIRTEMPNLRPYLTVSSSSQRNVEALAQGTARLAFSRADVAANLSQGQTASLRALARLYDDYLHLVARRDGPIRDLTDLRGRRVSIGPNGSSAQRAALLLLREAGMTLADLEASRGGLAESGAALRSGKIDAFFFFGAAPTQTFSTLHALGPPLRLVDLADWAPRLREGYSSYTTLAIPASTYDMAPVTTIGVPNYLLAPVSLDPDLAYALTVMLFAQRGALGAADTGASRELDRRAAINTKPIRLHRGAVRYYRDTKI